MDQNDFVINRLTIDYRLKPFDCGDPDLNEFLHNDARLYLREHLAVTYIVETETDTIAYFSVQNDKISLDDFPSNNQFNKARKAIPRAKMHKSYPAVKVGRLAVSEKFQGLRFGPRILDYLKLLFIHNNRTGCRFMLVDAYTTKIRFYEDQQFYLLKPKNDQEKTQLMYCDLKPLL